MLILRSCIPAEANFKSGKLTFQLNIDHLKMYFLLKMLYKFPLLVSGTVASIQA